ncbi:branched-chain amino acid ABC transporter substrate-binding protein [Ramlibacter tataouinensis]|uniref:branched-chain amino acid ABC transporter substrate-binding protein n=1 Tax=Ramlibacter tataouinensis TaxID=94132 RepID=UPI0022F3A98D|nr:branched-chain amino acid ABC transporter substrate-binding protein [Ramlibacter tataouinensis]WBY01230.1 branched-chain amino acid ABC transporter substrate-binding protein [Ramlibacter tataouinensis]
MHRFSRTALVLGIAFAGTSLQAQDTLVVRLGHVSPTSGPAAHLGADNVNGMRMAIDDLNAAGVLIGNRKARFEMIAEDDGADPKQGTAAAQKLCDQKVNGVVGHLTSGSTLPASRIYNDCGIPHISPVATNAKLTQQGYKTSFRLLANDNAMGAGLAHYAADTLKLKKVAVVDDRTAYGQGVAEVFKKTARSLGLQVVDEQYASDKSVDFTPLLTAIRAKNAEAIFYGGLDAQAGPMLRQMQMLGMGKVRLFGGDGICTHRLVELAGSPANVAAVTCGEGGASVDKMPGGAAWKKRYDARFPGQFQGNAPYGYDAALVLVEAMKRAGSADPAKYAPELFKLSYQGVTGRIEFDSTGELKNPAMTLFQFKDGRKAPLN